MDPLDLLQRAVDQTGRIVAGVKTDQLSATTPCTDWDVRGLLDHTIAGVDMFSRAAQAIAFDPSIFARDNVGDDPAASYDAAAGMLRDVLAKPGVIEASWTMPFGEVPGMVGASFATLETFQHGWDLARASGQKPDFDPEITEAAFATARMSPADQVRVPGVFGPEVSCPPDAPAHDRLAAYLGRTV